MISILGLFKLPIFRHIIAAACIVGATTFFLNKKFHKRMDEGRRELKETEQETALIQGKYEELEKSKLYTEKRIDTLQAVIIKLAQQDRYHINNEISGAKLKKGGTLNFSPSSSINLDSIATKKKWWKIWKKKNE